MRSVVHIGFHKTGTTTLQYQLFPALAGVVLLTRNAIHGPAGYFELCKGLCKLDDARYDAAALAQLVADVAPDEPGTLLLSDEGLSGYPYLGVGPRRENSRRRIQALLPDARILIGIRHQAGMWRSLYGDYMDEGGFRSFAAFADNRAPGYEFELDYVRFDTIIERYQESFGVDRVRVVPSELLVANPAEYVRTVSEFVLDGSGLAPPPVQSLEVSNPSLSRWSREVLRARNRLFLRKNRYNPPPLLWTFKRQSQLRRVLRRVDPIVFRNARRLSANDQRALDALLPYYEESNARVEQLTGLDLRRYGYPLPTGDTDRAPAVDLAPLGAHSQSARIR